ncbi:MAG: MarR family transcriptional regulator [Actinomycetota bacterium]|nr:MarR family transcriptional regulator [Actinomycetota bacterium]
MRGTAGAEPTGNTALPSAGEPGATEAARLRIAVSKMSRRLGPTAAAGTLTPTEVDMLVVAARRGPARMSDFASFCGLNPTMVSRLVPKLEEAGLLHTRADPDDKRARRVEATKKAAKLLERVRSERSSALARLLEQLEEPERRAVFAAIPALEKLAERLSQSALAEGEAP